MNHKEQFIFHPYQRKESICSTTFTFKDDVKSGSYGYVVTACCNDNCNYVMKRNKKSTDDDVEENERHIQHLISHTALSLPVLELVISTSTRKIGWIMTKLETSVFHELFDLSIEQREQAKNHYINIIDQLILSRPVLTEQFEYIKTKFRQIKSLNLYTLGKLYRAEYIQMYWELYVKTPMPLLMISDTQTQIDTKRIILRWVIHIAQGLYHYRISHGDLHTGNIMRDKEGRYYAIDFGRSRFIFNDEPNLDIKHIRSSIHDSTLKFIKNEHELPVQFDFQLIDELPLLLREFDNLVSITPSQKPLQLYNERNWTVSQRYDNNLSELTDYILRNGNDYHRAFCEKIM
jgi:hypothetical protein